MRYRARSDYCKVVTKLWVKEGFEMKVHKVEERKDLADIYFL